MVAQAMISSRWRIRKQRNGTKWIISRYHVRVGYVALVYFDTGAEAIKAYNTTARCIGK
jgi:hypothetical protein